MSVTVAKSAGFCFGVSRAVELVENAAKDGKRTVTLGPIIHNRHVVNRFQEMGVRVIQQPEEATSEDTVIIRSHGVSKEVCQRLEKQGANIIDATCPFVKRIHNLVAQAEEAGQLPIIIGTPTHPEVEGIAGWCSHCKVFADVESLEKWVLEEHISPDLPVCMVSQTTSTEFLWKKCVNFAKKQFTYLKTFDTICRATECRQSEASALSQRCQAMVVVGDLKSSNTGRLAMICREHCDKVVLVDNASELDADFFRGVSDVGITAGASTPAWIIKEVNKTMSEITNVEAVQEENFAELLEQSIKTLNTGDKVVGTVTGIGNTEVQVDLGTKHAGYIPYDEVSTDASVKPEDVLKVGDEIEVFVVRVNDQEGTVQLSKKKLDGLKVWDDMAGYVENKTTIDAVITEENKGGLVANVKGVRVFIPASQSGIAKGGDMAGMVGKPVQLKITEVNRARRRAIGSIRAVTSEQRKAAQEKIWSEIEVGKQYHGTVKSLTSYGAFVDIGGVDGLMDRRSSNHVVRMASDLDTKFFACAFENAIQVEVDLTGPVEEVLETMIQELENTKNAFVDGVPRQMIRMVLNSAWYGKIRNQLDKTSRANVDTTTEEFYTWHGVQVDSCINLPTGCPFLVMCDGAVAQPVMSSQYSAEKIPLSEAHAISLFYHDGTEVVTPDLILTPKQSGGGVVEGATKFKNVKTENVLHVTNEDAVNLCTNSEQYSAA